MLFLSIYMLYYSALGGQLVRAVCIFYATLYSVIHHLTYKLLMWIHNCAFLADHDSFSSGTSTTLFNQLCKLYVVLWQARTKDERCSLQHHTCVQMNMKFSPGNSQVTIAATCFVSTVNIANYAYMHIIYTQ